jgi:hypothetical protein
MDQSSPQVVVELEASVSVPNVGGVIQVEDQCQHQLAA